MIKFGFINLCLHLLATVIDPRLSVVSHECSTTGTADPLECTDCLSVVNGKTAVVMEGHPVFLRHKEVK